MAAAKSQRQSVFELAAFKGRGEKKSGWDERDEGGEGSVTLELLSQDTS